MAELVVIDKDRELFRHDLADGTVTIGRGPHNDIRLNSPTVAERHARISLFEGECQIQNLAAPGDTFVNDREVQRTRLFDHDVVRIGHYKIALQGEGLKPRPDADARAQRQPPKAGAPTVSTEAANTSNHDVLGQISELEATLGPYLQRRQSPANSSNPPSGPVDRDASAAPAGTPAPVETQHAAEAAPGEETPAEAAATPDRRPGPSYGLLSTGVDILSGPAKGKRICFTQQTAKLGVGGDPVLTIQAARNGYVALAADNGIIATINGEAVTHDPVPLEDGDFIDFANLRARFFVEP